MERDVDPNDTGSFDQMNLISLIARRPKAVETIEDMTEAIKYITDNTGEEKDSGTMEITTLKLLMTTMGEKMQEHEIEEILQDLVDITHEGFIQIDDLASYIMSR